jgi:hypothetical protein
MGCQCLTQEMIQKFHQIAKYGNKEVSVCISNECQFQNTTYGDVVSVERAGNHPFCTCVVHVHPQPPELKHKIPYSCMPSSSDIAVVIQDALQLYKNGYSPEQIAQYEDAVFYPCGMIVYSVSDIDKLIAFMIKHNITISNIEQTLSSLFQKIKSSCQSSDFDSHVQCVKAMWTLLLHEIGISIRETIL